MLIGDKVCLGPLLNGDGPLLFSWFDSPALAHMSGPYRPTDEAKFAQWLAGFGADPSRLIFAVRRQGDLRLVGYVHLTNIQPVVRSAELGLAIGNPSDQRQGFGQEAIRLALGYCWRDLNLQRVALQVLSHNPWALRAYEKAGFEVEGVMRRASYADGQFHDVIVMAVLRPESA